MHSVAYVALDPLFRRRRFLTAANIVAPGLPQVDYLKRTYWGDDPSGNLHFIAGTIAALPRTFIGLLRTWHEPAELSKQGELF